MAVMQMAAVIQGRLDAFEAWRRPRRWLNGELLASAFMLALSGTLLYQSTRLGLANGPQAAPGTFPAMVAAALVVCSAIWLAGTLLKLFGPARQERISAAEQPAPAEAEGPAATDEPGRISSDSATWRVVFVVLWSALLLPFTETVGMTPMLFVYLTGLFAVVARITWWKAALVLVVVLALFSWGAYEGRIYMPDPLRIGRTIHGLLNGLIGG